MKTIPAKFRIAAQPAACLLCALSVALAGCSTARPGAHQAAQPQPASASALTVAAPAPITNSPPPPPPVSFAAGIRLAALMDTGKGVAAAFVRGEGSGKHTWVLHPGDCEDGMELVEADVEQGVAVLKKGSEAVSLALRAPDSRSSPPISASTQNQASSDAARLSYAERLRARRQQQRSTIQSPKLSQTELEQSLRAYNMELIRAGGAKGPPLPIEISPEDDAQLVREGVLPP